MSSTIAEDLVFVDTNILVYAHDVDAGAKHVRARELVAALWESHAGTLSTQVLQEFYVTVTRKLPRPLDHERAIQRVLDLASWRLHVNGTEDIVTGAQIADRNQLSFWDGLIIAAARRAGAAQILSEDLQAGRTIEGILIMDPFI